MEGAEDAEEEESAQQREARAGAATAGREPHDAEADAEEEREDREEAVLDEVLTECVEGEDLALGGDGAEPEERRQVDEDDPAQGEAAQDIEGGDAAGAPRRGGSDVVG
ncbi:Uncharacterised protein [Mycobacteroides abscessus subsp. abscessus]|nr:Uncharacterised protein [Mycobacteroides abscessus subsp. abscessus]